MTQSSTQPQPQPQQQEQKERKRRSRHRKGSSSSSSSSNDINNPSAEKPRKLASFSSLIQSFRRVLSTSDVNDNSNDNDNGNRNNSSTAMTASTTDTTSNKRKPSPDRQDDDPVVLKNPRSTDSADADTRVSHLVGPTVRLMQWNTLADGLGYDGFLNTEFAPISPSISKLRKGQKASQEEAYEPSQFLQRISSAKQSDRVSGVLSDIKKLKNLDKVKPNKDEKEDPDTEKLRTSLKLSIEKNSELMKLHHEFEDSPQLKLVTREILSWRMRYQRIKQIILASDADVICLQEVDRLHQLINDEDLQKKYTCAKSMDPSKATPEAFAASYKPAKYTGTMDLDVRGPKNYLKHIMESGVAFGPKSYSNAKKYRKRRETSATDLDDDGVAIFWNYHKYRCVELGFLAFPPEKGFKCEAMVAVTLQSRTNKKEKFHVLSAHLPSGDGPSKELERLDSLEDTGETWSAKRWKFLPIQEKWMEDDYDVQFDGATSFVQYYKTLDESIPIIVGLDSNSRPHFPIVDKKPTMKRTKAKQTNTWYEFTKTMGLNSVWIQGGYLDEDGNSRKKDYPFCVSVNKMRGPASEQPEKIGEHQLEMTDYVFSNLPHSHVIETLRVDVPTLSTSPRMSSMTTDESGKTTVHMAPLHYKERAGKAELELLPSSTMPSDHLPVLVDIALQRNKDDDMGGAHGLSAATNIWYNGNNNKNGDYSFVSCWRDIFMAMFIILCWIILIILLRIILRDEKKKVE